MPRGRSRWGSDREYGYGWWIRELGGRTTYYAWGYGGQFIFVVPDLDLVVVTTSRADVSRDRRDHNDGIYHIVGELVIAALAALPRGDQEGGEFTGRSGDQEFTGRSGDQEIRETIFSVCSLASL